MKRDISPYHREAENFLISWEKLAKINECQFFEESSSAKYDHKYFTAPKLDYLKFFINTILTKLHFMLTNS